MSLSGTLETMPLPDILQFIGLGRKSGVLHVRKATTRKELMFESGRAVFCTTSNPKEHLGQHLLARTPLTEEQLERAFRTQEETRRPLGEVLVSLGMLAADEVRVVLEQKVLDSMYELFEWTAGRFEFEERVVPEHAVMLRVDVDWQDLLMEGARRADEMAVVREVIPTANVRFRTARDKFPPSFPRTTGDRKLVTLVEQGLTAGEICPRFHASDFDILKRLATLVRNGLLVPEGTSLVRDPRFERETLLRTASELAQAGRYREAIDLLRDGAHRFFDDADVQESLHATERLVRQRAGESMADLKAVPRLVASMDQLTSLKLTSKQAFVVSRLNAQWSVRSIVQICPFDEADVLAIVDELAQEGLVALDLPVGATG